MSLEPVKVAGSFIDAMKGNPLALALCVMNVMLLGFLYYTGVVAHDERKAEMELMYQNRSEMAKLLYQCTPPAQRDSGEHH